MLKTYKPVTPASRFKSALSRESLCRYKTPNKLTKVVANTGGRNFQGNITVRHRYSNTRKRIRLLNTAIVASAKDMLGCLSLRFEHTPSSNNALSVLLHKNKSMTYEKRLAYVKCGYPMLTNSKMINTKTTIKGLPTGSLVSNIAPTNRFFLCKSAGSFAKIVNRSDSQKKADDNRILVVLRSGEQRLLDPNTIVSLGPMANEDYKNTRQGKAGILGFIGRRPHVRGVAKNPVDHPHGGARKGSTGRPPVSPTARLAKGKLTRKNKRHNNNILVTVQKYKSNARLLKKK